jgi:LPXTG-site transpeptidase (sortase) family protein
MIIRFGGSSYTYEVRQEIDQVDPSDVKTLMAHQDDPWLTLVTCKGYDEKTNTYRWRYIVRAVLTGIE